MLLPILIEYPKSQKSKELDSEVLDDIQLNSFVNMGKPLKYVEFQMLPKIEMIKIFSIYLKE